jgi:hypothetical protein
LLLNTHHLKEDENDCETSDSINLTNLAIVESELNGFITKENQIIPDGSQLNVEFVPSPKNNELDKSIHTYEFDYYKSKQAVKIGKPKTEIDKYHEECR